MSTLNRLFRESNSLADFAGRYASYIAELLDQLDYAAIDRVGGLLVPDPAYGPLPGSAGPGLSGSHLMPGLIGPGFERVEDAFLKAQAASRR